VLRPRLLATLMAACLFGLGAVLAKSLGESFDPFVVSWLALLGGGCCILAFQALRRKPLLAHLTRAGWVDLFLFASIGTALPQLCIIAGLPRTGAITGGFLLQLQAPALSCLPWSCSRRPSSGSRWLASVCCLPAVCLSFSAMYAARFRSGLTLANC
jgi:drug/metabolite transporter (DMT)-like permease